MRPAVTIRQPPRRPPKSRERAQVRRSPSLRRVTAVSASPLSLGTTKRPGSERCSYLAVLRLRDWAPRPGALFRSPAGSCSAPACWRGIDRDAAMPAPSVRFRTLLRFAKRIRSQTFGASFCRPVVAGRGAEGIGAGARSAIGGLRRGGVGPCINFVQRESCIRLNNKFRQAGAQRPPTRRALPYVKRICADLLGQVAALCRTEIIKAHSAIVACRSTLSIALCNTPPAPFRYLIPAWIRSTRFASRAAPMWPRESAPAASRTCRRAEQFVCCLARRY